MVNAMDLPTISRAEAVQELEAKISLLKYYASMSDNMELHRVAKDQRREAAVLQLALESLKKSDET